MSNTFQLSFEQDLNFIYSPESIEDLSEYEKYELSFHPERPKYLDYISIFDVVEPCFESDEFGACLIQTHRAELDGIPVMLVGPQSGPSSNYEKILFYFIFLLLTMHTYFFIIDNAYLFFLLFTMHPYMF